MTQRNGYRDRIGHDIRTIQHNRIPYCSKIQKFRHLKLKDIDFTSDNLGWYTPYEDPVEEQDCLALYYSCLDNKDTGSV